MNFPSTKTIFCSAFTLGHLLLGNFAHSACILRPANLEKEAFLRVQANSKLRDPRTGLAPSFPIRDNIYNTYHVFPDTTGQSQSIIHWENFVRPPKNMDFDVFNLFSFTLRADIHLLYICVDYDSLHPSVTHIDIYPLTSYALDGKKLSPGLLKSLEDLPGNFVNSAGSLLRGQISRIGLVDKIVALKPIPVKVKLVKDLGQHIDGISDQVPFLFPLFKLAAFVVNTVTTTLWSLTSQLQAGVERVTITPQYLEFYSHVDIDHPERSTLIKRIPLEGKQP